MKHLSSSTEDLLKLFNTEVEVIKEMTSLRLSKKLTKEAEGAYARYQQALDYQ